MREHVVADLFADDFAMTSTVVVCNKAFVRVAPASEATEKIADNIRAHTVQYARNTLPATIYRASEWTEWNNRTIATVVVVVAAAVAVSLHTVFDRCGILIFLNACDFVLLPLRLLSFSLLLLKRFDES